ncbi:MAG TPA: MotA/TolQ/ExbB proton channel family protein [Tepidisphaeraceae bacterium]|nr:MotA/TolQ/ExbB proton channel family protein [Tepidisphaeraceae bacterium]
MRQYASSKFRLLVLIAMMAAAVVTTTSSFAQDGGTGAPAARAGGAQITKEAAGGLLQLIIGNVDAVTITIVILSIIGLTLIIQGFIKNRASVFMPESTTNQIREMIAARRFKELIDFTERDPSFVSRAINPALKRAPSFSAMKEAMETSIGEQTAEQFRRIEYLNIIGNLGPLLGLLGTVLGMIYAFQAVQNTGGQADVGALSGGIAVALAHTFMGLFLAVPCLAAFGILRTIVDRLTTRGALVAEELLLMIKPQEAKPAATGAMAAPRPAAAPIPARRPGAAPTPAV